MTPTRQGPSTAPTSTPTATPKRKGRGRHRFG
jgi:hypothetical protein